MPMHDTSTAQVFTNHQYKPDKAKPLIGLLMGILFFVAVVTLCPFRIRNYGAIFLLYAIMVAQWTYILAHKNRIENAGMLLLEVGPNKKMARLYKALSLLSFLAGLFYLIGFIFYHTRLPLQTASIPFLFSMGCFNYYLSKNSWLELYENGILHTGNFLAWEHIYQIVWDHNKDFYLVGKRAHIISQCTQLFRWPVTPSSIQAVTIVLTKKFERLNAVSKPSL
jgi:hypothetical protein